MSDSALNPGVTPAYSSHSSSSGLLRLFVYGTLKRGFWNHDHFCQGFLGVEDAWVRGRLFETSSGIPVLRVPEEDILAVGTANPLADVAAQAEETARFVDPDSTGPLLEKGPGAPWGIVHGEIFTFDDPESRLPAIDGQEGFNRGRNLSLCIENRPLLVKKRIDRSTRFSWERKNNSTGRDRNEKGSLGFLVSGLLDHKRSSGFRCENVHHHDQRDDRKRSSRCGDRGHDR